MTPQCGQIGPSGPTAGFQPLPRQVLAREHGRQLAVDVGLRRAVLLAGLPDSLGHGLHPSDLRGAGECRLGLSSTKAAMGV